MWEKSKVKVASKHFQQAPILPMFLDTQAPGPSSNHNLIYLSLWLVHWILENMASCLFKLTRNQTRKSKKKKKKKNQCCYGLFSQLSGGKHSQPIFVDGWVGMIYYRRYPSRLPRSPHLTFSAYRPSSWTQKWHMTQIWPITACHYSGYYKWLRSGACH